MYDKQFQLKEVLTHCGIVTPYGIEDLVDTGSDNEFAQQ